MARRFVDLSVFLENDVVSDPPAFAPRNEYSTHQQSFSQIEPFSPGLKQHDLPEGEGEGWAVERVTLSTHNGTHLDAGRDIGYCHLEKLHNIEALPAEGFFISCFPHKIRGASAGWTRAVAMFDDALNAAGCRPAPFHSQGKQCNLTLA